MAKRPIMPAKHHGITCDNCGMEPILGHRFKCINCIDFDLCTSCEELTPHNPKHTFLKIRHPLPSTITTDAYFPFIPAPLPRPGTPSGSLSTATFTTSSIPPQHASGLSFHPHNWGVTSSPPSQSQKTTAVPSPTFIDTVNQFGFKLLSLLAAEECPAAIAPSNIYRCLMMAAAGSQGANLDAFAKVLSFDATALHGTVKNIVQLDGYCRPAKQAGSGGGVELEVGSSVWYGRSMVIEHEWAEIMRRVFEARFGEQDAGEINAWVREKTKGRIQEVVKEHEITDMDVKLISCLYFKAGWERPFEKSSTKRDVFCDFDGAAMPCDMMHRTGDIMYWEDEVAQMCVLPYRNSKKQGPSPFLGASPSFASSNDSTEPSWNAAIILPKHPGISSILAILSHFSTSPSALRSLLNTNPSNTSNLSPTYLHLSLPRFTLTLSADLSPTLFDRGLRPISLPSLNFAPMTRSQPAFVTKIKHDLFVEVNEEGTEVAAATTMAVFGGAAGPVRKPVEMRVGRPFLFLVFDGEAGVVVAMGVVNEVKG